MKIANAIHTSKAVSADAFSTGDEGQGFALCSILNGHFIPTAAIVTASTTHHYSFLLNEINNSNSSNSQVTIQHIQKVFVEVMNLSLMVILFMFFFSGIVKPFASISITDDIPTVSNLDAIKSKEERTSLSDAALPTATQVDIEEISKQLTLKLI